MRSYDVAVIGAGVFGAWTAWHLRRHGCSVLLIDAWGPAHARASSGGESRIIRMGYGADEIYTRMAIRSLPVWRSLCAGLFHHTGVLWIAREDDPYNAATIHTMQRCGVSFEILSAADLRLRYPQMCFGGDVYGILESESGAIMARRAVVAVVEDAIQKGVEFTIGAVQTPVGRPVRRLTGEEIRAQVFVFACGPWLPKLFPELLRNRIRPTRQEVFFFTPPAGDRRFSADALPVWIDFSDQRGPYGFPDLEYRGVKLAFDRHGPPIDPDTADRLPAESAIVEARRFLAAHFPALTSAPLAEARVCQYENTSNGDFLIDRHPDFEDTWLVGGGSGHGFKHGPALGEHVANCVLRACEPEPRFALGTKGEEERRSVY